MCSYAHWLLLLPGSGSATGNDRLEHRYVTTWSVEPFARMTYFEPLEVNTVRCRVRQGRGWSDWWAGRVLEVCGKRPTWHLQLGHLRPGTYQAQFDLRTPLGAKYVEASLRVPIAARFAGKPIAADTNLTDWPHRRIASRPEHGQAVLFAWDEKYL